MLLSAELDVGMNVLRRFGETRDETRSEIEVLGKKRSGSWVCRDIR